MRRIKSYYLGHTLIDLHVFFVAASFVLWLVSKFTRNNIYSKAGYILLFVTVLSFIIHRNLRGLSLYMKSASGVTYLPAKRIRGMNRLFVLFYLLLSATVMIILPGSFLKSILVKLKELFKAVISRILRLIFGGSSGNDSGITATHDVNYNPADGVAGVPDWLRNLLSVFQDIMKIVAIAFILYLIYVAVSALYRYLTQREPRSEVDDYTYIETDGIRTVLRRNDRRDKSTETASGASLKVRKLYKSVVQHSIRKQSGNSRLYRKRKKVLPSLLSVLTPSEIETFADIPSGEQYDELHYLYEKARYSKNGVTDSEQSGLKRISE